MRKPTHPQPNNATQPISRQQVFLHVVVGSLVLCAVLVPPAAQAGVLIVQEQHAAQPKARGAKVHLVKLQPTHSSNDTRAFLRALAPLQATVAVLNNMTVCPNGKRLFMQLEMSHAQAGNLLRQHLAIP